MAAGPLTALFDNMYIQYIPMSISLLLLIGKLMALVITPLPRKDPND